MKGVKRSWAVMGLAGGILLTQIAGCGGKTYWAAAKTDAGNQEASLDAGNQKEDIDNRIVKTVILGEGREKEISYEPEDLDCQWDEAAAGKILLEDKGISAEGPGILVSDKTAVIQEGGTFVVSGSMENGQIRIDAAEGELVRLALKGVEQSNKTTTHLKG